MQATLPSRLLADQRKPHRYVPSSNTDIRVRFERERRRLRLLNYLRRPAEQR